MSLEINKIKIEDIQLQPLRISTGWRSCAVKNP